MDENSKVTTPCDIPHEDENGNTVYVCPYIDSGCSESELCRVMCGAGCR